MRCLGLVLFFGGSLASAQEKVALQAQPPSAKPATWSEVLALPAAQAGSRSHYGPGARQFGDLRLPATGKSHPVVVILHGGCWQSAFNLDYIAPLADSLSQAGFATWNLEYRGIGDEGGGWPGTFDDVVAGIEHLRTLARSHPIDLDRVVLVGHSAGGHLALWAADRGGTDSTLPSVTLPVRGVVTLAGIADLRAYAEGEGSCNQAVVPLMGGDAATRPERYAAASPSELLPAGVPMRMLVGAVDPIVPPTHAEAFAEQARKSGDEVEVSMINGAGHFDLVMPRGASHERLVEAIRSLVGAEPGAASD